MSSFLWTSESVSRGHPDKIADQISDACLDLYLSHDKEAKVACETLVTKQLIILAGEIRSKEVIDISPHVRSLLVDIGYKDSKTGIDPLTCKIRTYFTKQSSEIIRATEKRGKKPQGAGDQGFMYGFATNETAHYMPLPIMLAHGIIRKLEEERTQKHVRFLEPDAKAQVTIQYDSMHVPKHIDTVVLSTQHSSQISVLDLRLYLVDLLKKTLPAQFIDNKTKFFVNPAGKFLRGGPRSDTGVTGRKQMVDTYGGISRHGGGAFSGKDPSKPDRFGSYMARFLAKNIVAHGLAKRCEVQLAYAIGIANPLLVQVNTFGTGKMPDEKITSYILETFDLTPDGIILILDLLRPKYLKTAFWGHFGRDDPDFTWEQILPQFFA